MNVAVEELQRTQLCCYFQIIVDKKLMYISHRSATQIDTRIVALFAPEFVISSITFYVLT
jgi:hypothetical protein